MLKYSLLLLILLISQLLKSQTVYSNFDAFKDACISVQPGDELILANGSYNAETIKIENIKGTAEKPVIIRAEEIGKVILNKDTYFDLRHSSYISIQGFIINISENSTTFKIQTCNHIRITQNILDGAGEAYYQEDEVTERNSSVWISIQSLWNDKTGLSHHNKIDHNFFKNKHTLGNMIRIDGADEKQVSQYDVIEYNHFKNMGPRAENEMEAIRVGWSAMSESNGFCTIQSNLFEECNGDPEIISVKCNKNTVSHNTFRRCQGTLSLRHGNNSLVEGNFFIGEGEEGTGGIRIYGSDHRIVNNYFDGLTGTKWDAPITLTKGDAEDGNSSLSKHFRIERAVIANNTVVNCDYGIEIGYDNNGKYSKPPRDVIFANNIVWGTRNVLVNYINQPVNMTWSNNVLFAGNSAQVGNNVSFIENQAMLIDPVFVFDSEIGMCKSTQNSPTYNTINNSVGNVDLDIEGQIRIAPFNYGADELETSTVIYKPLHATDVGVTSSEYIDISPMMINVPKEGNEQRIIITSNLSWKVTEDADWLTVTPLSGDGDGELTIETTENLTIEERIAQLTIESTNADQYISKTITIIQTEKSVPYITVVQKSFSISSAKETLELSVLSNTSWNVSAEDHWLEIATTSGEGNGMVKITIQENASITSRFASVFIGDGSGIHVEIQIEQQGAETDAVKLPILSAVASTEQADKGNVAANVIDGDLSNRWSGEGDGAHITLDLGEECKVAFVKAGVYKANERHSMFDILSSCDDIFYQEALMDITTEITEDPMIIYDFNDVAARFIRIVGHGNSSSTWNSYTEFEIWGYSNSTSSNDIQKLSNLKLFPNPSEGILFLDGTEDRFIEIYNLQGICMIKQKCNAKIDVGGLKPGIYLVKVIDEKGILKVSTFVKK